MIEFGMRSVGEYLNVYVRVDDISHDLGLHDIEECRELIDSLQVAIDDMKLFVDNSKFEK